MTLRFYHGYTAVIPTLCLKANFDQPSEGQVLMAAKLRPQIQALCLPRAREECIEEEEVVTFKDGRPCVCAPILLRHIASMSVTLAQERLTSKVWVSLQEVEKLFDGKWGKWMETTAPNLFPP